MKEYGYQPNINIGTAGHVDHGKTTLVEAITGVWTSGHSEELKRGITIKVGYADAAAFYKCSQCPIPLGYSSTPKCANCGKESTSTCRQFRGFSGTRKFNGKYAIRRSIDGWCYISYQAANEKVPQPQTREHLLALQVLGIKQIVIVQK